MSQDYGKQFPKYGKEYHYQGVQQIAEHLIPKDEPHFCAPAPEEPDDDDQDDNEPGVFVSVDYPNPGNDDAYLQYIICNSDGTFKAEGYWQDPGSFDGNPFKVELEENVLASGDKFFVIGVSINTLEVLNDVEVKVSGQTVEYTEPFGCLAIEDYDPAERYDIEVSKSS